jgi:hypothetical protein
MEQAQELERGRAAVGGKADSTGTCQGNCGGKSTDCYCDSECEQYGDCCSDKDEACGGGQFCGGIANIPCPAGQKCVLDGNYPDAGGKCVKCPEVMCMLYCENGFETDENGCEICKCKQDPCWGAWLDQNGNCRTPADGVYPAHCCEGQFCGGIAGIPCPVGQKCVLDGNYPDAGGKCVKCPEVMCMLYCENGFETDENGCDICKCKEPERKVASGACVKNSFDSCTKDSDCISGGCGGELCFNPAFGGGISTCECVQPTGVSCGCVNGKCAWWN